jgi:hypothetical protein
MDLGLCVTVAPLDEEEYSAFVRTYSALEKAVDVVAELNALRDKLQDLTKLSFTVVFGVVEEAIRLSEMVGTTPEMRAIADDILQLPLTAKYKVATTNLIVFKTSSLFFYVRDALLSGRGDMSSALRTQSVPLYIALLNHLREPTWSEEAFERVVELLERVPAMTRTEERIPIVVRVSLPDLYIKKHRQRKISKAINEQLATLPKSGPAPTPALALAVEDDVPSDKEYLQHLFSEVVDMIRELASVGLKGAVIHDVLLNACARWFPRQQMMETLFQEDLLKQMSDPMFPVNPDVSGDNIGMRIVYLQFCNSYLRMKTPAAGHANLFSYFNSLVPLEESNAEKLPGLVQYSFVHSIPANVVFIHCLVHSRFPHATAFCSTLIEAINDTYFTRMQASPFLDFYNDQQHKFFAAVRAFRMQKATRRRRRVDAAKRVVIEAVKRRRDRIETAKSAVVRAEAAEEENRAAAEAAEEENRAAAAKAALDVAAAVKEAKEAEEKQAATILLYRRNVDIYNACESKAEELALNVHSAVQKLAAAQAATGEEKEVKAVAIAVAEYELAIANENAARNVHKQAKAEADNDAMAGNPGEDKVKILREVLRERRAATEVAKSAVGIAEGTLLKRKEERARQENEAEAVKKGNAEKKRIAEVLLKVEADKQAAEAAKKIEAAVRANKKVEVAAAAEAAKKKRAEEAAAEKKRVADAEAAAAEKKRVADAEKKRVADALAAKKKREADALAAGKKRVAALHVHTDDVPAGNYQPKPRVVFVSSGKPVRGARGGRGSHDMRRRWT